MIFVSKGQEFLTTDQLSRRTQTYISRDWPQWKRERSFRKADGEFNAYMESVESDTDTNRITNAFNWDLHLYKKALARLAQSVDEDLEATIEVTTHEANGDDVITSTNTIPNPLVVQDEEERASAQLVVDNAPEEIVSFGTESE